MSPSAGMLGWALRPVSAPHPCERGGMQPFSARHSLDARARSPTPGPFVTAHAPSARALQVELHLRCREAQRGSAEAGELADAITLPAPTLARASAAPRSPQRTPLRPVIHSRCLGTLAQPPPNALLARLVHRMVMCFVERGLGPALCMCLLVSLSCAHVRVASAWCPLDFARA